jgi:hypothetical protein
MRFIEASSSSTSSPFHVLRTSSPNGSHALPLSSTPIYHIMHASSKLNAAITSSLRAYIAAAIPSTTPGQPALVKNRAQLNLLFAWNNNSTVCNEMNRHVYHIMSLMTSFMMII